MKNASVPRAGNSLFRLCKNCAAIFGNKWIILLMMGVFAAGCKKVTEVAGLTGVCPKVVSTSPIDTASNVDLNKNISATFNEAVNASSITATTFTVTHGTTPVAGVITYVDSTATFSPTNNLLPNTVYTATITKNIKDAAGNSPVSDYVWTFTTGNGPDVTAPTVTSTDPANAATGVAFNKKISATFSEVMDSSTITNASFTVENATLGGTPVAGTVTYSGTTAIFNPTGSLLPNTTYAATITTAAKDKAGNAIAANYIWNFTTGAAADTTAPSVIFTAPSSGETGVVVNKKITATFSEAMDPATISTATFMVKQGSIAIAGTVTYAGTTATFSPAVSLLPNTTYTGTITTGAKDLAGNALANNYVWSFTTGAALDVTPPTVIATDPNNGATNVALNKKVIATFSELMDPLTITTTTFTITNGTISVTGTVIYSGNKATFSPSANLLPNTTYTGTVTTGVKDLAGNAMVNNYVWSFTTTATVDITPPTVIMTDPLDNAINVPQNKKVAATFSEAMNPLTINSTTFTLKQGLILISGSVTYKGVVATFSPTLNLAPNTTYTATVTTGAKDLAGNSLVSDHVWTFSTRQKQSPPVLGSISIFGAFGGNAGITNQGLNTVINNGSIGSTAASTLITGFHDGTTGDIYTETPLNVGDVKGRIYTAPPAPGTATSFTIATRALFDATNAYISISPASKPGGTDPGAGELGGLTLFPSVYQAAGGTFKITNGDLTLDAKGDPNAIWIFQSAASLTVGTAGPAGARNIILINGAQAKNVYWYVGSSATINGAGGGVMVGTIIASSGITFSTAGNAVQTVLNGRAISLNASVTMVNTTINVP